MSKVDLDALALYATQLSNVQSYYCTLYINLRPCLLFFKKKEWWQIDKIRCLAKNWQTKIWIKTCISHVPVVPFCWDVTHFVIHYFRARNSRGPRGHRLPDFPNAPPPPVFEAFSKILHINIYAGPPDFGLDRQVFKSEGLLGHHENNRVSSPVIWTTHHINSIEKMKGEISEVLF